MVEPFIQSSALSASVRGLSNVLDDLYTYLKSQASIKIKKADIQRKLPLLSNYIDNVRLVKTLWQIDKPVDVESFYCDSHIVLRTTDQKPYRKKVDFVADLDSKDNFVIQGIAGQGKSILLRHIFINEASLGDHIPIFIEFRRIQKNETLFTHIFRFLQILDLPTDDKLFQILLKSGKFMFFLDGFDEIPNDQTPSILNELEHLTSISRNCQFIVTSRLNSPVAMSPQFNVVSLDDLQGDEYEKVIRKLSNTKEYADAIIAKINDQKPGISGLLCTPLLVTLLLVSYKSYQTIPIHLSGFYESIFISLLQRHDGTKPAFTRPRRCSLNDNQYRQVFDAFCFESKKLNTKAFDYQQIYSAVKKAMSLLDIDEDADAYIKDIKNITCLLLEESNQYRFIHGTVQEYYSASFVKSLPEPSALKFYQACIDSRRTWIWLQELKFLRDIDPYRHAKYYFLSICSRAMGYEHDVDPTFLHPSEISLERTKNIFAPWTLDLQYHDGKTRCTSIGTSFSFTTLFWTKSLESDAIHEIFSFDYTQLMDNILNGKIVVNTQDQLSTTSANSAQHPHMTSSHPVPPRDLEVRITIRQILDQGFLTSEFESIAQRISLIAYTQWQQTISYLDRQYALAKTLEI
jgi:hypothetical protein